MKEITMAQRIRSLRYLHNLSMDQLAMRFNPPISRQTIAKYEAGKMSPRYSTLKQLCRILHIDEDYIRGKYSFELSVPHHRNPEKEPISDKAMEDLMVNVNSWLASYLNKERLTKPTPDFVNPLEDRVIRSRIDVEQAALALRMAWHTGDGPIASIARLAERKGIRLFNAPLPKGLLGTSMWADNRYPLIVATFNTLLTTTERLRFTIAHEIGHLLLHFADRVEFECKNPDDDPREKPCEIFAGNFLLPRRTLYEEIGRERDFLTLKEVIDIKEQYGVSVAAIIHQAWDLRIITRQHYDYWYDHHINKNRLEIGWGEYPVPETLGREMRLTSIVDKMFEEDDKEEDNNA